MKKKIAFLLPHFDVGGVERVVLNIITNINGELFEAILILGCKRGALLGLVPKHIKIIDLGGTRMLASAYKLSRCLAKNEIGSVYSGTNACNMALLAACCLMKSKPITIVSEHAPLKLFLNDAKWSRLRQMAMRYLYIKATSVVVPVIEVGNELKEILNRPNLRVVELQNPLISDEIINNSSVRVINKHNSLAPTFVSAGRLVELKGFDILLKEFAKFHRNFKDAKLIILGSGVERSNLESLIKKLQLEKHVQLMGTVLNPMDFLKKADAFVIASRMEGFGNVLIEAMGCGIPVIAVDCPFGPKIILSDGKAGYLCKKTTELSAAMRDVINKPEETLKKQITAFEKAKKYAIKPAVRRFEEFLETL